MRALQFVHGKVLNFKSTGQGPNIAAINMSLGGGHALAHCDKQSVLADRIRSLRADGVATVIAAGNEGYTDGRASEPPPARQSPSALEKDGRIASYSNRSLDPDADLVDIFATGSEVMSAVPGGGYERNAVRRWPHPVVAGAIALLRSGTNPVQRHLGRSGDGEPSSGSTMQKTRKVFDPSDYYGQSKSHRLQWSHAMAQLSPR
ncbi:MAG: hypothetical protein R3E87_22240 [Burkholderiaceae bacterium]